MEMLYLLVCYTGGHGVSIPSEAGMPIVGAHTSWTMEKLPESCASKFLWRLPDAGITD